MKENIIKCNMLLLVILSIVFMGCKNLEEDFVGKTKDAITVENMSPLAQSCVAVLDLQTKAVEDGLSAISKYINIDETKTRALTSKEIELDDFILSLPDDYLRLTRKKTCSSRSLEGCSEDITLGEELDEIAEKFEQDLKKLIPNPMPALTLDYVQGTDTGLLIGSDMEIPYNSIDGIMTVNILNAIANGEDAASMVKEIENYVKSNYYVEEKTSERAVWEAQVGTWTNGVINYHWGDISDEHKSAVLTAMRGWESKTNRKIQFNEYSDKDCDNFFVKICLLGYVKIYDDDISSRGKSTIGYIGGKFCKMRLRKDNLSGNYLKRTANHELGHVLGLKHEHQRYDRDKYIYVEDENNSNYKIIPRYDTNFRFESKRIKIGCFKIRIWYPVWWESYHSYTLGSFDFNSVMLYENLKVQENKLSLNGNKPSRASCN